MRRVAVLALAACSLLVATSSAVAKPQVVTFKLVVEGQVRAVATRTLNNALLGLCKVNGKDTIYEDTEFARGKGVRMEFLRWRQHGTTHYGVQRVGRSNDASFAVVYKLKRKALGQTTVVPAYPPEPCFGIQGEDFATNPDCGKTFSGRSNWGLRLKGDTFSIRPLKGSPNKISDCGKSSYFGSFEELDWQWPAPYPYDFEPLPLAKLFGHTKRFKETLVQPDGFVTGMQGDAALWDEHGPAGATVRFIRVPNAP